MSMASGCFWHQVSVRNETHDVSDWAWVLCFFELDFGAVNYGVIHEIHLYLHQLWILLSGGKHVGIVIVVDYARIISLVHQVLPAEGQAILHLLLQLLEVEEILLWLLLQLWRLGALILDSHIVFDRASSFVIDLSIFHRLAADKVSRSTRSRKNAALWTSIHISKVSEISRKVLLSHFEL